MAKIFNFLKKTSYRSFKKSSIWKIQDILYKKPDWTYIWFVYLVEISTKAQISLHLQFSLQIITQIPLYLKFSLQIQMQVPLHLQFSVHLQRKMWYFFHALNWTWIERKLSWVKAPKKVLPPLLLEMSTEP